MVKPFRTIDATELLQRTFPEPRWFAKGLLGTGCYILASKPKFGKSIWCLQLGTSVVSGTKFLGCFEVTQTGVCVLQPEDGEQRAQDRLWSLIDEIPPGLRILEEGLARLDTGLLDQIALDLGVHPNTGVYIIDTFASVRPENAEYSYQVDYSQARALADFATERNICIILVHHCRKAEGFGDEFDDISGTNGLTGGATGMIVLAKDQRNPGKTIMSAKGKDIEEASWRIELVDKRWHMIEPMSAQDIASYTVPECVMATIGWMDDEPGKWTGTTTELYNAVGVDDVTVGAYGKFLAQHRHYMLDAGVDYCRRHTRSGSIVTLVRIREEGGYERL